MLAGAGAAALVLAWWAATRGTVRYDRAYGVSRVAPKEAVEPSPAPSPDAAAELAPPEPVLQQSAGRRFSSPSSHGAAAGGIPGVEEPEGSASREAAPAARGSAWEPNLPGGYGAPTSAGARSTGSFEGGANEAPLAAGAPGAAAPARTGSPAARGEERGPRGPGDARAPEDRKLTGAAGGLVAAARDLKTRGDSAAMRAESGLEAGIMRGLALDDKVDAGIRGAISDLQSSGRPVTAEAVAKAAHGVLKDNGFDPDEEDVAAAVARASSPPPNVPPGAYAEAAKNMASTPPLDPETREELRRVADKPPPPRAPAPRGAIDAFKQYQGVLGKAEKDFGVKPEHILGILGVETTWGRNTGKFPIVRTLEEISGRTGPDGRPTRAAKQAASDLKALARLSAQDNLGGLKPSEIRSSYAGAMGVPQFLPTSWEAYSRAPDGGKRDPFNFGTAAYSVGNYLKVHGYNKDVARSIWGYNHSQEYVDKVLNLSADVKAGISATAPPPVK